MPLGPLMHDNGHVPDCSSLNADINADDVIKTCKLLKRNKAADVHGMRAEYIVDTVSVLAEYVANALNKVFRQGFPDHCSIGVIHPIFKAGDPTDPMNYRGITVGDVIGKLYATILDQRLSMWARTSVLELKANRGLEGPLGPLITCFFSGVLLIRLVVRVRNCMRVLLISRRRLTRYLEHSCGSTCTTLVLEAPS